MRPLLAILTIVSAGLALLILLTFLAKPGEKDAVALRRPPSNPSAQLVKL
jgi:hypothetical protein